MISRGSLLPFILRSKILTCHHNSTPCRSLWRALSFVTSLKFYSNPHFLLQANFFIKNPQFQSKRPRFPSNINCSSKYTSTTFNAHLRYASYPKYPTSDTKKCWVSTFSYHRSQIINLIFHL